MVANAPGNLPPAPPSSMYSNVMSQPGFQGFHEPQLDSKESSSSKQSSGNVALPKNAREPSFIFDNAKKPGLEGGSLRRADRDAAGKPEPPLFRAQAEGKEDPPKSAKRSSPQSKGFEPRNIFESGLSSPSTSAGDRQPPLSMYDQEGGMTSDK